MAFISNQIGKAIGAASGSSGSTLQDFLSKFGSSAGKLVDALDPLATFDVSMALYPSAPSTEKTASYKVLDALGSAATSAVKNIGDNLTGGLVSSLINDLAGNSVTSQRQGYGDAGKYTFMQYLAKAQMLVGGENWFNSKQLTCPLELQLGLYVQSAVVPSLKLGAAEGKSTTMLGEFPVNGMYVIPDNNSLQLDILCTKLPLMERIFYPWMREVTLPYWSYETQPYTTATVTIDFSKHTDIQYVFCGCRPSAIQTIQPTQQAEGHMTRQVTLMFDFMFINSRSLPVMESTLNKLIGAGTTLLNSAAGIVNL